jgi:alcohol dehydrogenase
MQEFDFRLRPRIVFGAGSIQRLGELARELGALKILVVSDQGVVNAGLFERGKASLEQSQLIVEGFHDFAENPNTDNVNLGLGAAQRFRPDLIVGLGGGSSMDCAKGINFLYSCGGRMQDYWGIGKAKGPMLPMIAVPTTSGTGSETQSFALISDAETHVKMACGDPGAACKVAILDPELTVTQPNRVTALTGIDAITHALETYVCNKRTPISECFSLESWERLIVGFPAVLQNPNDLRGRSEMQLGACFAGMAIEASMLGAAHALANPLTAYLGTPHGQAVGLMMPHVIRFNAPVVGDRYARLVRSCSMTANTHSDASTVLSELVTNWLTQAGLSTNLTTLSGWPAHQESASFIEKLGEMASKQWTASFNPRSLSKTDFIELYTAAT